GCICISEDAARQVQSKLEYPVVKVGKKKLKNIQLPMEVYKIVLPWENDKGIKSLSKTPANSFLISLLILLTAAIIYFVVKENSEETISTSGKRIAVIPFANFGTGTTDDYFADGVTEEFISNSANIHRIYIIQITTI